MKNSRITFFLFALFFLIPQARADIIVTGSLVVEHELGRGENIMVGYQILGSQASLVVANGGLIWGGVKAYENSIVRVSGGQIWYDLEAFGNSSVEMWGGAKVEGNISTHEQSQVLLSGVITAGNLIAGGNSNVYVDWGTTFHSSFYVLENSHVSVNNVQVSQNLVTRDNGYLKLSGGTVGGVVSAEGNSQLIISGTGFTINGLPVGYGKVNANSGFLAGKLDNGNTIANNFYVGDTASIFLIPEPAALLLLGLGGMVLRRRHHG